MKVIAIGFVVILAFGATLLIFQQFYYTIAVTVYHALIRIYALVNKKAALWVKGRVNLFDNLKVHFQDKQQKTIWFHCASLGEFEQGRPVIEQIKKDNPEYKILLTFYSPSGYENLKNYAFADYICYLPADSKKNATQFLEIVNPALVIFIKYEFWIHHINAIHAKQIPLFLVSGIFRPKQIIFKWYVFIFRKTLKKFTRLFVQNEESLELLQKHHITNAEICYDTRFDRVKEIAENRKFYPEIKIFTENYNVIVAGSTWPKDELILSRAFYRSLVHNNFKIIIVPHQIDAKHLQKTKKQFKKFSLIYSELHLSTEADLRGKRVMIIDNIGMLSSLYQYADINFIGGGFNAGIHNSLEAAVYGKPLMFGPKFKKFNEAVELIKHNAAFEVRDYSEILNRINLMNQFDFIYSGAGNDAKRYVQSHLGGTQKVVSEIEKQMELV